MVSKELTTTGRPAGLPTLGPEARLVLDVAIGLAGVATGAAVAAARTAHRVTAPLTQVLARPPLVPARYQPASLVARLAMLGHSDGELLRRRAEVLLDVWTPAIVAAVVERLDLTRLVAEHVDLDAVVAGADLDAAVARVDIEAVIDRVDLDAVAARLDVDAVVARADLDAAVRRVDIDAVIARVDLVAIVEEVLDEVDLPGIIRDSTGSVASETVRGVRMTGISADDAIGRAVDRALFRRRRRPLPGAAT